MKQVGLYAVLLTVAMVGAYVSWTSESSSSSDEEAESVAVYNARAGDVKKLTYDSDKLDIVIERRSDKSGDFVWVTIDETKERKLPPKPHDHGDHGGEDEPNPDAPEGDEAGPEAPPPEPEVVIEEVHKEFLGNDSADGLFATFEPLMALRELKPSSEDLENFGLTEPEAEIRVGRSAGETTIALGGETYGSKDRYAKQGDRVLLVEDTSIRPLQFAATRLVERRLHPLEATRLDRVVVQRNGANKVLVQNNKDDRTAAFWALEGEDTADDTAATWIEKLNRIKASEYASDADVSAATIEFSVELAEGSTTWGFQVLSVEDKVYARSTFNRGVVELTASLANEAIQDLGDLFQE